MLIAEARVETDRPGRYLTQICQHLSNKGRHLGTDEAGKCGTAPVATGAIIRSRERPSRCAVEWSETDGTVTFPGRAMRPAGQRRCAAVAGRGRRRRNA